MSQTQHRPESADNGMTSSSEAGTAHEALYDRFAERASTLFSAGQEKSREAMDKAIDTARSQLSLAGDFSAEQGDLFKQYMRRDLAQTEKDMRTLSQETWERLHPARLGAVALSSLARMLEVAGSTIQSWSHKADDALSYSTGDITTAGTMTCVECGQILKLRRSSRIPPCPSCSETHFRKGY